MGNHETIFQKMKKVIIVGASSGIGKGLAQEFARQNCIVGITGRRTELLQDLKSENPDAFFLKSFDISETKIVAEKLNQLVAELGGLDLLIISSGIGNLNEKLDFAIEQETIQTNISGFSCVANWAFNFFETQKFGHLVAITSIAGLRGSRIAPAYNASKAFQINYLEGFRQKAKNSKNPIFITDIRPGLVNTDMAKGEGLFWVMPVEKAVNQIFKAILNKKEIAYVTKRWFFIAMILKIIPRKLYNKM